MSYPRFFADLHIHSRYSIACSRDLTPENLVLWCQMKGIGVIGTGDFTHPRWLHELQEKLHQEDDGLLTLKDSYQPAEAPQSCQAAVKLLLSTEISCIFRRDGKVRKVHALVFVPDFATAKRLNDQLEKIGNIAADGRPILRLDVRQLLELVLESSPRAMLVPAHAWTPHFSVLGAGSGFNSLAECFGDLSQHVHAIETGLSSDPAMNWRISSLSGINLISNSDAHSLQKLGREATIFTTEKTYDGIMVGIKSGAGLAGTVEFFPQEGKYYCDGHRQCHISMTPQETRQNSYLCPSCGKKATVGVWHRVESLADRPEGHRPSGSPPFHAVVQLHEIIAEVLHVGTNSKKVQQLYFYLIENLGNEMSILLDLPLPAIATASPEIAEAIGRMRRGAIQIRPGYDGQYGKISILGEEPRQTE